MGNNINNLGNFANFGNYGNDSNRKSVKNINTQKSNELLPDDVLRNFNNKNTNFQRRSVSSLSSMYRWRDSSGSLHSVGSKAMSISDYFSYGWAWLCGRAD